MTEAAEPSESTAPADRHASWLELFFDLVVVAAVHQLAHVLPTHGHHGPDRQDVVVFFTLYMAIWLVWTTFTLYSNVLADRVRIRSMFLGMAGIAVMAASVPEVLGDRADIFAAAYLITSGLGTGAFTRSGQVLVSWAAASRNAGLLPWVVSFWVADPRWKLTLWLLGLAMTLYFSVLSSRADGAALVARLNERLARRNRKQRDGKGRKVPPVVAARIDTAHLGERLGLFVIIVLGEGMLLLVDSWSAIDDWTPGGGEGFLLIVAVAAGLALLLVLWALNFGYAFTAAHPYPPAVLLPAHFVLISSITAIAVGVGAVAGAPADHLPASTAWLMCSGVSAYLLGITLLGRMARRWWLTLVVILLPPAAAVFDAALPAAVVPVALLAACLVQWWNLRRALTSDA